MCTAWRSAQRCFGSGRGRGRVIEGSVADGASLLVQTRRAGAYGGGGEKKKKKKKKKKEEEEEKKNAAGEGECDR